MPIPHFKFLPDNINNTFFFSILYALY